jgi:TPR repeat protein
MILALMLSLLIQPAFAEENYADLDIDQLRTKAEQGNARAQLVLGVRYEQGQGVFQNHEEAARWYRFKSMQGDANAQFSLASMYRSGHGVPPPPPQEKRLRQPAVSMVRFPTRGNP